MGRDLIVIGGSAGSIDPLKTVIGMLPRDLPAAVAVVVHLSPTARSELSQVLNAAGGIHAQPVERPIPLHPGCCYVAPPDRHILIQDHRVVPWRGPKEDRSRPAINPLFRSAASSFGPRLIAVLLSGVLGDGSAGLWSVKQSGGVAVVQDPATAQFPDMPQTALEYLEADYVVDARQIAPLLVRLTAEPVDLKVEEQPMNNTQIASRCPDCGGPVTHVQYGDFREYRCLIGHAYSPRQFLQAHAEAEENALWSALGLLEESDKLIRDIAPQLGPEAAQRLEEHRQKRIEMAKRTRELAESLDPLPID